MLPPFWIISLCSFLTKGYKIDLRLAVAQINLLMDFGKFYCIPSPPCWSHLTCLLLRRKTTLSGVLKSFWQSLGLQPFYYLQTASSKRNCKVAKWAVWPRTTQRVLMCVKPAWYAENIPLCLLKTCSVPHQGHRAEIILAPGRPESSAHTYCLFAGAPTHWCKVQKNPTGRPCDTPERWGHVSLPTWHGGGEEWWKLSFRAKVLGSGGPPAHKALHLSSTSLIL